MPIILLIEPNKDLRLNLKELLEIEGYDVRDTISIHEIQKLYSKIKPDAIVLDELNLNGAYKKLVKYLKKKDKPVVIILNKDGNTQGFEFADTCLSMPFSVESLTSFLKNKLQ